MAERAKIKVQSLTEMNALLDEYHWPAEMFVPLQIYELVKFRVQTNDRVGEGKGEFVWFAGVKIRPPKHTGVVDLSDAEVIDASP